MLPPEANKRHIFKQQKNNLIPTRTSHHNTPFNPLSRGESKTTQTPNFQIKKHHPKPPLSRGAGGVSRPSTATSNQMLPHQADKHHLTKQQQNNLIPTRTSHHNTPLNPLSRGESKITQITHYQEESTIQKLPSREGQGVCNIRAQLPQIKCCHPKPTNATSSNSRKTISSQPAHLTITHPSIPSQEGKPYTQPIHYQQKKHHPNLPSREGQGVCHVRAQLPQIKCKHTKPRKKHLKPANSVSKKATK